jgi:hypothetical protein
MDTDMTSDQRDNNMTHRSRVEGTGLWVAAQLLHNDEAQIETRSLLHVDNDEPNPDLATEYGEPSNTDASVDLCIELGSWDMIDIDEDTNYIFLTIDINPFLVIDSYAYHN